MKGSNTYSFDGFALIKVTTLDGEVYFKVFGSRSGGYLDGDSWRLNSGVVSAKKDDNYYYFRGESGSCYKVPIGGGHISSYCSLVLLQAIEKNKMRILIGQATFVIDITKRLFPALPQIVAQKGYQRGQYTGGIVN